MGLTDREFSETNPARPSEPKLRDDLVFNDEAFRYSWGLNINKPTVLLDIDDVLLELNWEVYLNLREDKLISMGYDYDSTKWGFSNLDKEVQKQAGKYYQCRKLFNTLDFIDGAEEFVHKLHNIADIVFVTSAAAVLHEDRELMLKKLMGDRDYRLVFTDSKSLIKGDIRIDDGYHNLQNEDIDILFAQPWNAFDFVAEDIGDENVKLYRRTNSYNEILQIIKKLFYK